MISPLMTDADKAKLLALLAAHELSDTEPNAAANELNKPQPATVQRPKPFDIEDLLKVVAPANAGKIMNAPLIDSFIQAVGRQDRKAVGTYAAVFAAQRMITTDELAAAKAVLETTEDYVVNGDSWFKAEFPNYAYSIVLDTEHESSSGGPVKDDQGNVVIFHEAQHCSTATAALIEEARS